MWVLKVYPLLKKQMYAQSVWGKINRLPDVAEDGKTLKVKQQTFIYMPPSCKYR